MGGWAVIVRAWLCVEDKSEQCKKDAGFIVELVGED